jgi:RAB6A-GEF complex partner protein 1
LVPVGQIAFHGVVRAPTRVRSVSWVLPDAQLRSGDPSRDVEFASVLFLVDDKLVLLQPARTAEGALKYDMRVIAQHVEYYILMRDQVYFNFSTTSDESGPPTPSAGMSLNSSRAHHLLRDSLWTFGSDDLRVWGDVREVLRSPSDEPSARRDILLIPVDFYPLSILLTKGIILGIEAELVQRRDVNFALLRSVIQTHLFIPYILRHQICDEDDVPSALALAQQFEHLSYFPHALEILLHNVLDDEADRGHGLPANEENAVTAQQSSLPKVLSFLQTALPAESYLSTIVQCVRKTELSSWHTLFAHLPTPVALFEEALQLDNLKTASGYLIVLQGMEEENDFDTGSLEDYVIRLMKLARRQNDFELCAELARFMIAIDPRGAALRRVIDQVGFRDEMKKEEKSLKKVGLGLRISSESTATRPQEGEFESGDLFISRPKSARSSGDYFSASPGEA